MENLFEKKHQIFISSTYSDLIKARSEVIKVILDIYQIPIGMEMFSADNDDQWNTIKKTIDSSDYYLLIFGHRYGSLTKETISYTEKEFDYAKTIGIPILSFIRNRDFPTSPDQRDREKEKEEMLNKFLDKVQNNSMCDYWSHETELAKNVAIALPKIIFKTPRIGWIRSDQVNNLASSEEITKLSKENRELRKELKVLKDLQSNDKPSIIVLLNGLDEILLKTEPAYSPIEKVTINDLPDRQKRYVSKQDFEVYNCEIDKMQEEVKLYNVELDKYHNIHYNSIPVDFEIVNTGNIKLNDLYIDIKFPEELIVLEDRDKKKFEKPDNPLSNINPISKANNLEKEMERRESANYLFGEQIGIPSTNLSNLIINKNKKFYIDTENNILTIKLEKLTHTRKYTIKDEILVSVYKKDKYKVQVEIISDELKNPIRQELSIIVE